MILVTGGTGLVGSHLLYQLSLKNDVIKAIHRKNSDLNAVKKVFSFFSENSEQLFNKIDWVEADITDIFTLEKAFKNVTKVYHAAAFISFNPKDYRAMRKINIEGTANIVNFCIEKNIEKLCYVSSIAAVGSSINGNPITEANEWDIEKSNYGYAITKYGGEMEVWRASQEGVPVVIVNPSIILGIGFWNSGSGELFSKINNGVRFYTEGTMGYVSALDVAKAMIGLMASNIINERYILAAENLSYKKVFIEIAKGLHKKPPTIKASKKLTDLGWRLDWLKHKITGSTPVLTKQTSITIHEKRIFSSEKIKADLNFEFEPISKVLKTVCNYFLKDHKS